MYESLSHLFSASGLMAVAAAIGLLFLIVRGKE